MIPEPVNLSKQKKQRPLPSRAARTGSGPPAAPGTEFSVMILGEERLAQVLGAPAYDPESKRPRM